MALRLFIVLLCSALFVQPVLALQSGLKIEIVQGDSARYVVQQIVAAPRVRVVDSAGNPVAGAVVSFSAPDFGPSGEFSNDGRAIMVETGVDGIAATGPYHPNGIAGRYQINVRAVFQGLTATTVIRQENIEQGRGRGKLIAILAIAGGAIGAVVAASRNGDGDPAPPSVPTITFGGAAVGAPTQ
jgi:hypothetical protein